MRATRPELPAQWVDVRVDRALARRPRRQVAATRARRYSSASRDEVMTRLVTHVAPWSWENTYSHRVDPGATSDQS